MSKIIPSLLDTPNGWLKTSLSLADRTVSPLAQWWTWVSVAPSPPGYWRWCPIPCGRSGDTGAVLDLHEHFEHYHICPPKHFRILQRKPNQEWRLYLPAADDESWKPLVEDSDEEGLSLWAHPVLDHHPPHALEEGTETLHPLSHALLYHQVYL